MSDIIQLAAGILGVLAAVVGLRSSKGRCRRWQTSIHLEAAVTRSVDLTNTAYKTKKIRSVSCGSRCGCGSKKQKEEDDSPQGRVPPRAAKDQSLGALPKGTTGK